MKIFGSDGFRSRFGESYMTLDFLSKFSWSLGRWYQTKGFTDPIAIGRDTRSSGEIIHRIICSTLNFMGIGVTDLGVIATPMMSFTLANEKFAVGIMITASHNPHTDNGVKLLASNGQKLDLDSEGQIAEMISCELGPPDFLGAVGTTQTKADTVEAYLDYWPIVKHTQYLHSPMLVDCSNGGFSSLSTHLADEKNLNFLNAEPDGSNINLNAGALEAPRLLKALRESNSDYGVAFDGDGDRAVFVSKSYGVIEAEKLAILFVEMLRKDDDPALIVTTEIVNKALVKNLARIDATVLETEVGDRNVINSTHKHSALFGFEPSGHFFFPKKTQTMDGFGALYLFLQLLHVNAGNIDQRLSELEHHERVKKDIYINDAWADIDLGDVYRSVSPLLLKQKEKLVIRKSMWDPVLRIYYDYEVDNRFLTIESAIQEYIDRRYSL